MRLEWTTPPAATDLAIDRDEVSAGHLRVVTDEVSDAGYVDRLIRAAMGICERRTQRCLAPQTWTQFDNIVPSGGTFAGGSLELRKAPVIEVEAVSLLGGDGDWTDLAEGTDYDVAIPSGPTAARAALIFPVALTTPTPPVGLETIRVRYRAGYVTGSPEQIDVPFDLQQGMLLVIGELYKQRSMSVSGLSVSAPAVISAYAIFDSFRLY